MKIFKYLVILKIKIMNNIPEENIESKSFKPFRRNEEKNNNSLSRKDVFIMSFFGFIAAVFVLGLISLVVYGSVTGYITVNLPEEKKVVVEDSLPVIENTTNESIVVEEVPVIVENTTVVEEEPSDPCDTDMVLTLNKITEYNGRQIKMILVSDYAARIAVGGSKPSLLSVGETLTINRMEIYLADASDSDQTATIQVVC